MISNCALGFKTRTLISSIFLRSNKRYSFVVFAFLFTVFVNAQTTIWEEDFNSYPDGVLVGTGNRWILNTTADVNGADSDDYFKVVNGKMELKDSNWNEQIFITESIDVSAFLNITVSLNIVEEGVLETYDYANVFYSIDSGAGFGPEIPFAVNGSNTDDFDQRIIYQSGLSGLNIKIILRLKNSADLEYYKFDDILVQGEDDIYYDSDYDGLFDNIDIDDDNDGIIDINEEFICSSLTCDSDNDGVYNSLDLDSDDDGIPDVFEAGLSILNNGAGFIDCSNAGWLDDNADGLHDTVSLSYVVLDTDSDSVPNFLDLDSDNDSLFDIDESQAGNSFKPITFENGDADIDGDGTGDYLETEVFRIKDFDGDGLTEVFGDGIQNIYEHSASTYGNLGQADPLNSDGNGLPDYANVDRNGDGVWDISETLYASYDTNNDGFIDDTSDSDGDGIVDLFDTDDSSFGSPRDLNRSLYVYFDGRNDYVEDTNILNGASSITLMAWIVIDDSFSSTGFIVGQEKFNFKLNNSRNLVAAINGSTVTNGSPLNTDQWIHVAFVFDGLNSFLKLYVNGEEVDSNITIPSSIGIDTSNLLIGKNPLTNTEYFYGGIEEVRVFDIALTELQVQKLVYQKIKNNGMVLGETIPFDTDVSWSNLIRYYRMDSFKHDIVDDRAQTENSIDDYSTSYSAKCFNIKDIKIETAPMPFVTEEVTNNLDLAIAVSQNNNVRGNDIKEFDWSITHIKHNIDLDINHSDLGLIIDTGVKVNLNNDTCLNNDWYLKIDGFVDLNGESQLVQSENSYLATNSLGYIEKDQQGSANSFTYNYWSSPVGLINTDSNNKAFYLKDVFLDGSLPNASFREINFGPSSNPYYSDGSSVGQIKLASYWLWRFVNSQTNDYANWEWIGSGNETGSKKLNVTEGYTMKGVSGLSSVNDTQNYVFKGKPNNAGKKLGPFGGDLEHTAFNGSFDANGNPKVSLTGNPFPSALDAHKFIDDNEDVIEGQLYFWEHWGGNTHQWSLYQGGYAILNKSGGVSATSHPDVSSVGSGSKAPGQYVPIGQGFYVIQKHEYDTQTKIYSNPGSGTVVFKNSQRIFKTESNPSESIFIKELNSKNIPVSKLTSDEIQRIRIKFRSSDGFIRPLMLAFLEGASEEFDYGYDAYTGDLLTNDALFIHNDRHFVIQSFGEFNKKREIAISVIISDSQGGGIQKFMIDELENIPNNVEIYIKDYYNDGVTYDIKNTSSFDIELEAGEHKDRFALVFQPRLSRIDEIDKIEEGVLIFTDNNHDEINIMKTAELDFQRVTLFNSIGQQIKVWDKNLEERDIKLPTENVSSGVYIVILETRQGVISKKIIIK